MTGPALVFAGPTIAAAEVAALLPGAVVLPPAAQGDVYRAVRRYRPRAVGLIDGLFGRVASVWHREILWALSRGVHVFGAASMGALRAAELAPFGMRGVGTVFEAYRAGRWPSEHGTFEEGAFEDDDEVAVAHAPAALRFVPLSDAMVDIRATLAAAAAAGALSATQRADLTRRAKATPYAARQLAALEARAGVALAQFRVGLKHGDARAMLQVLADLLSSQPEPFAPGFTFVRSSAWVAFERAEAAQSDGWAAFAPP